MTAKVRNAMSSAARGQGQSGLVCGHKLPARQVMRFLRKPTKAEPNDSPPKSWNHHIKAQSMSTSGTSLRQGVMGSRVRDEVGTLAIRIFL